MLRLSLSQAIIRKSRKQGSSYNGKLSEQGERMNAKLVERVATLKAEKPSLVLLHKLEQNYQSWQQSSNELNKAMDRLLERFDKFR